MEKFEIEAVAQAFYGIMEGARGWDREPERLRARFRSDARAAIAALNEHRGAPSSPAGNDSAAPARSPVVEKKAK